MSSTVWKLYDSDSTKGTCKAVSDDAGLVTLTVDNIAASVAGAIAATTLSTSGLATLGDTVNMAGLATNDSTGVSRFDLFYDTVGHVKIAIGASK
jgi:hypothetical protein